MFELFCRHPASVLHADRDVTRSAPDEYGFEVVTMHLYCMRCSKRIDKQFATSKMSFEDRMNVSRRKMEGG